MIRARTFAPSRFVTSDAIAINYPALTLRSSSDELVNTMKFIEQLLPDRAFVVCKRSKTPSVQYASENCRKILGLSAASVMKMSLPEFLTRVHPDDTGEVDQCFAFVNSMEPYDPLEYRFTFHYRIRHGKGHYINISDEKMALSATPGKYMYINCFRDSTGDVKLHDVRLDLFKLIHGDFRLIHTFIPRLSKTIFTPRQRDIMNLMSKGFNNSEIAGLLSVSANTIRNHKNLLFRKMNVKSSIELLNAVGAIKDE
ncbi:MAG TPA: LuxR C-terminal-related transcriptional regulator [Puia sp.]|nr:LuxR C-terminal-related transcriptional regulator [Puia sp.]